MEKKPNTPPRLYIALERRLNQRLPLHFLQKQINIRTNIANSQPKIFSPILKVFVYNLKVTFSECFPGYKQSYLLVHVHLDKDIHIANLVGYTLTYFCDIVQHRAVLAVYHTWQWQCSN